MHAFNYAVRIEETNARRICQYANNWHVDLSDDLDAALWYHLGSRYAPYLIMAWDCTQHQPISFNTMHGTTFEATWHFTHGSRGPFQRIWRNSQ